MDKKLAKIKVIFNDSYSNLPNNESIPQGGVARFAQKMVDFYKSNHRDIELISLLFSHNPKNKDIFIRKTVAKRDFYELVYPREILQKSYKKDFSKIEYNKFLQVFIDKTKEVLIEAEPDLVFLNGFGLSNWIIMEAAHKLKLPVCIQHAGLWKKEIITSGGAFSLPIKKIFSSYEKEIFKKTVHQIFLNEFSRDELFKIHNISKKDFIKKTSIIALPIETDKSIKVSLKTKNSYEIGVVARWDRIKNHGAIYRIAKYLKDNYPNYNINLVTKWDPNFKTDFKTKYENMVNIIEPMSPKELKGFYKNQDIVLIPSRFDVSPTVLMESILLGKPVLISKNVGWVSDYKKLGLSNLVFDYTASGEKIFNKINKLIENKDKYIVKFNHLQDTIIKRNKNEKVFEEYYKLFKKIIKNAE